MEKETEHSIGVKQKLNEIVVNENVDIRLKKLATAGLIEQGDYAKFMKLIKLLDQEKTIPKDLREMVVDIYDKLINYLTKDKIIFNSLVSKMRTEQANKLREETEYFQSQKKAFERKYKIFDHDNKKYYINEKEEMIDYTDDSIRQFIKNKKERNVTV
jgi:hypothetical protein